MGNKNRWPIRYFTGGISQGDKRGIKGSFDYGRGLDYYTYPDLLTAQKRLVKDSGSTVTDLPLWIVRENSSDSPDPVTWMFGDSGELYSYTKSTDTWANPRTVSGGAGKGLQVFDDYLYYMLDTTIGRYGPLSGTPAYDDNFLDGTVDQRDQADTTATGNTYTLQASITETAAHRKSFVPDKHKLVSITINVAAVGTGDWTVTVHDEDNTSLGSKTITNGSMSTGDKEFEFTTAIDYQPGATYHFHVTSTVADGTITTSTASDHETAYFYTEYQILDSATWHPAKYFPAAQALCIGNGRFLAVYDGIAYRNLAGGQVDGSERLAFSKEEEVRALAMVGDYLAIATTKGSSINDHGESFIYFWNGTSPGITSFKEVSGEVHAMEVDSDGLLHILHGSEPKVSVFSGRLNLVHSLPLVGENKYSEVYPGAITKWNGLILFGISDGDSTTVERTVYSYGMKSKEYPRSLNSAYPISTGTVTGTGVQIGAVAGFGPDELFVAWKDSSTYGVDILDTSQDQTEVTYDSLIFDADRPDVNKRASSITIMFDRLASGQTIEVYTKVDRATSWSSALGTATYANTGNGTEIAYSIPFTKRFYELQVRIKLKTTTTDAPKLISITTYFKMGEDEQK